MHTEDQVVLAGIVLSVAGFVLAAITMPHGGILMLLSEVLLLGAFLWPFLYDALFYVLAGLDRVIDVFTQEPPPDPVPQSQPQSTPDSTAPSRVARLDLDTESIDDYRR